MHAIHIRIRGNYNIIEPESLQSFFNIQGMLKQIEFFIFIYHFFRQPKTIQWFTTQTEYSLGLHITRLGDRSTGAVPLCYEDGSFFLLCYKFLSSFGRRFIIKMKTAIA